jgi:hypothetical protein
LPHFIRPIHVLWKKILLLMPVCFSPFYIRWSCPSYFLSSHLKLGLEFSHHSLHPWNICFFNYLSSLLLYLVQIFYFFILFTRMIFFVHVIIYLYAFYIKFRRFVWHNGCWAALFLCWYWEWMCILRLQLVY